MLLLAKPGVQITIVDNSKVVECDAHCGAEWASAQTVDLAGQRIKERFGDRVQLEYLDLAESTSDQRALELKQRINGENLSLPLLIIDGEPRISGRFDIRQLLDAIEAELEIRL